MKGSSSWTWAGVADVFRAATLLGAQTTYRVMVASVDGSPVRSDSGVRVVPDTSLTALDRSNPQVDTLLVMGGLAVEKIVADERLPDALRRLAPGCRRVGAVCTGAFALAAAGLLDHHQATTHWASCGLLASRHPDVEVLPDRIYVHDRDCWTSAGVTAAIDLALAMVEGDHGQELAHKVARWLVVFVRRPGGQAQFSVQLRAQPARTPALVDLQRWLPDNLAQDLSVDALARRAGMSTRNFARAFKREVGSTPASLVEGLRVEAARRLLETSDLTIQAIAQRIGIRQPETLHRAFNRRLGTTPDRYRQHFRTSPGGEALGG